MRKEGLNTREKNLLKKHVNAGSSADICCRALDRVKPAVVIRWIKAIEDGEPITKAYKERSRVITAAHAKNKLKRLALTELAEDVGLANVEEAGEAAVAESLAATSAENEAKPKAEPKAKAKSKSE